MSRSSPGVHRVVAILNFFADHPGQSFTLTDLVRALRLSRATCHALLAGLVEAGYLYRAGDKSYVLGPALAAIGRTAQAHFSPLQVAQPEMRALADEFDAVCSAVFREGNDVVVRERAASVSHLGFSVPRGTRLPLRPPFAGIYFAWSPPAEAEAWVAQLSPPPSAELRARMQDGMAFARAHGFCFGLQNARRQSDDDSTEWLFDDEEVTQPVLIGRELRDAAEYRLASVVAPVFDAQRQVAFVLGMMGFSDIYTGKQVAGIGQKLRAACDRVTEFIAGRRE